MKQIEDNFGRAAIATAGNSQLAMRCYSRHQAKKRPKRSRLYLNMFDVRDRAKRLVKAELKRADVTYEELARRLTGMGLPESKASVASKLSRGAFPATFMLATLKAIGCQAVRLDDF